MSSSPPPSLVWFLLLDSATGQPYKGASADKVPVSPSADVADFQKKVKEEYADSISKALHLRTSASSRTSLPLTREMLPSSMKERKSRSKKTLSWMDWGRRRRRPSLSNVVVPSSTSSSLKPFRQKRYKAMSVEASCRKYLDAIALKLASVYEFDYKYDSGPTIGDVFAAKDGVEGDEWSFRRAKKNHQQIGYDWCMVQIQKGQPLTNIKLPDIFTADEWKTIRKFNYKTCGRIRDGNQPSSSNGRPYIVIPHAEFTPEMISFLKTIGMKTSLFASPDVLEVKDEDVLSEGSSIVE